jgi:hypothetical protein
VERLNDFVDKVACEDETTVLAELFHEAAESRLHRFSIHIVCLINDHILPAAGEGNARCESFDLYSKSIDQTTFLRTVNDDVVRTNLIQHCLSDSSLTYTSSPRKNKVWKVFFRLDGRIVSAILWGL